MRSASGRVFTLADDGDQMARTNVFTELSWFWLALSLGPDDGTSGATL
jgi:hypothetical protein